jgi:hypothetical protein
MTLFGKYTLADLTITNTGLPNMPTEDQEIQNLTWLAKVLGQLEDSIGPFTLISAFRSPAVQQDVGAGAVAAGKKSFHEVGLAADIYPTTMTLDDYFGKILDSEWRQKLGEIIYKKSQNTIHIGLPTSAIRGKIMFREANGTYRLMTQDEIDQLAGPHHMTYAPTGYGNNDGSASLPDPSGGIYTDLFMGMYGKYDDVEAGSFDPSSMPDYSVVPSGELPMKTIGVIAALALVAAVVVASN